jgi:alpha-galactosidase
MVCAVEIRGEDLTGKVVEAMESNPELREGNPCASTWPSASLFRTESNGHLSEYIPWYRRTPEEMKNWLCLASWIGGETGGYLPSARTTQLV